MAFVYYSPISINAAQVPSPQTDFPVLVNITDNRFRTVGNGGNVQNANGYDIRPYTNSGLGTPITGYDLERYNASTGEVVMSVKVSSLSSSTTPFVLAYGNSSITTDGSSTSTWSNSFLGVYHFADGSSLNVNSSTGLNNGINHSATAAAGQIDGCAAMVSASSQYVELGSSMNPTAITLSGWAKATSFPASLNSFIVRNTSGAYSIIDVNSSGKLSCFVVANGSDRSYDGTGSHTLLTGTWYYLTMTYSSATGLIGYVNAESDGTATANGNLTTTGASMFVGNDPVTAGRFWNGSADEIRVANVARAADWITTEYNNQSAPGTFETLGSESVPAVGLFTI